MPVNDGQSGRHYRIGCVILWDADADTLPASEVLAGSEHIGGYCHALEIPSYGSKRGRPSTNGRSETPNAPLEPAGVQSSTGG